MYLEMRLYLEKIEKKEYRRSRELQDIEHNFQEKYCKKIECKYLEKSLGTFYCRCDCGKHTNGIFIIGCELKDFKEASGGEKEMVKKGIGNDGYVDNPKPIRLSSNEKVLDVKEGIPSIHSKPPELFNYKDAWKGGNRGKLREDNKELISEFVKDLKKIGVFEFEIDEYRTLAMAYYSIQNIIKKWEDKIK